MTANPDLVRNRILRSLPAGELVPLLARLEYGELVFGTEISADGAMIEDIHFVESGTVSIVATLEDGGQAEVGLIGREGVCGMQAALGSETSAFHGLVQVGGSSRRMTREAFTAALAEMPVLQRRTLEYIDAFLLQVSQTAVCNVRHQIEQRLARWILMTADRIEQDRFPMTQQFMATMLGVQRPGVTLAIRTLQRAGLVEHDRTGIRIVDRDGLSASACECYGIVRRRFEALPQDAREADDDDGAAGAPS